MPAFHIELRSDGPHSDANTIELAHVFAEIARTLNYATRTRDGLSDPHTAYTVVGNLAAGVGRLHQLLGQISTFMETEAEQGRLTTDYGRDRADQMIYPTAAALHTAKTTADQLSAALSAVQSAMSHLRTCDTPREEK